MSLDRLPPHNVYAERALLGGILRYPDAMLKLQLHAEEFYTDAHQRVFRSMLRIAGSRKPIDMVLLAEDLRRAGDLEDVGGVPYITELWGSEPTGATFEYHAEIVRDAAQVRALIHAANETLRDACDRTESAADLIAQAERRFLGIAEDSATITETARPASEFLPATLRGIDDRIAAGGQGRGLPSGYAEIDEVLNGADPGELIVIAARPSVGKTALALNWLANVATAGTPVLLFSLEMPLAQIAARLLSMGSGVPLHRFTKASSIGPEDAARLTDAAGPKGLGGCPIYVDDTSDATAARVGTVARRMVHRHGVKLTESAPSPAGWSTAMG